jgi:hypothetical protein
MRLLLKFEVACGMATLLISLLAIAVIELPRTGPDSVGVQVAGMIVYFLPALLVCLGSYLHAVGRKMIGFIILWVGGLALIVWLVAGVFGGVLYLYGLRDGLGILSPSIPAIVTLIISLLSELPPNRPPGAEKYV